MPNERRPASDFAAATRPMLKAMGLQVIQGPPNSGRAGEVLARFRAVLEREPVLVVPTGDDVAEFERQLCGDAQGAALGGSISTFGALTAEVARALAVELPPTLDGAAATGPGPGGDPPRRPRARSGARPGGPGFAPALDALIAELQAALISPSEFEALVAELDDPGHEIELARLYASYVELRDASEHADPGLVAEAAIAALRGDPEAWDGRPVLVYGFDDLSRAQLELLAGLARAAEVTVAVDYEDRGALAVRAPLLGALTSELGAERVLELPFDQTPHREPGAAPPGPQPVRARCAAGPARRRAGADAVRRRPGRGGGDRDRDRAPARIGARARRDRGRRPPPRLGRPAAGHGPARARLARRPGGVAAACRDLRRRLAAPACRAAADDGAVDALLAHLRSDPSFPPAIADRRRAPGAPRRRADGVGGDRGLGAPAAAPREGARGARTPAGGCGRWRARRASWPRALTASARPWRAAPPTRTAGSRSRRSSCAPGSPRPSCSTSSRRSAGCRGASSPICRRRSRRSRRRRSRTGAVPPPDGSGS